MDPPSPRIRELIAVSDRLGVLVTQALAKTAVPQSYNYISDAKERNAVCESVRRLQETLRAELGNRLKQVRNTYILRSGDDHRFVRALAELEQAREKFLKSL